MPLSVVVVFFLNVNKYFQEIPQKHICGSSRPLGIQRFALSLAKYCVTKIGFRIWLFSMSQIELNSFTPTRESILFVLEERLDSFKHNIGLGEGVGFTGGGNRCIYYANKGPSVSTLLSHIVHSVKMAACSACFWRSYATVFQQGETYFPWYSSTKTSTSFSTVLQNELKSDVARFTTHVQTCLATNQVVANWVNTDFWLDKITPESRHTRELRHLMQNKFVLGKTLNMKRFCCKK